MLSNPVSPSASSSADFDLLSTTGMPFKSLILVGMVLDFCLVTEKRKEDIHPKKEKEKDKVSLPENSTTVVAFL